MSVATTVRIVLVMFLWAICFPLITTGIAFAPHLTFAALRAMLAGLTLTGLAFAQRRPIPKGRRAWGVIAVIGVGATSLGFLGMFHAAEFVSPGIATVIANTQPLLAASLAGIVLGERLTRLGKMGLGFGFVGILVIASPQLTSDEEQQDYILGLAYILLAALGITVSNVMIKWIAGKVDSLMAMGLQLLIGSIPLFLGAWATEEPAAIRWSLTFILILLALSVFGSGLVYWLWISVLKEAPLNRANAFSFLIPVFGLTMGAMFYNETLGWSEFVGISLTVLGVGLVTRQGAVRQTVRTRGTGAD